MIAAIPGLDVLGKAVAYVLNWLSNLVGGNYGLAIILLTILMRIVIMPLSIKQTRSMIEMQKLQPQLKEIQKKFKDDREKMGQEMMALYKENKVSPLGGCLPLLLQLPIMFAVFEVLRSLSAKTGAYSKILAATPESLQFLGMNITHAGSQLVKDQDIVQLVILILLTVATGYVSSKMMMTDPKQSKMMAVMPLVMGVFAWILPAGVTIYIIVTNIFTMVQQYVQLEHDGFYDEKLNAIRKQGEEAPWHRRLYLKSMDFGTTVMVALRLRPRPGPKQPAGKPGAKAAGKPAGKPGAKAAGKPAAKKSQKSSAASRQPGSGGKQQGGAQAGAANKPAAKGAGTKSPAGKKASSKGYPAKKKGSGKK